MRPLFLGLAGLLLVSASDPAPAPIIAKPALWKVADADTTIYLFGTIHMLKPGTRWFDGKIRTAFDSSQELVIEMIEPAPGDAQRIVISHAIDPDGPPLTSKLTPADAEKYRAALHSAGLAAESYEQFQPWFVSTLVALLPMQKLGYDPSIGAEKTLVAEAKKAQKKLGALETMEQQIGFFANLPEAQQIRFLNRAVRELPEADKSADRMVGDWAKGQPDKLARVMNEGMDDMPEIKKVLLTSRNARWADWIAKRLDTPGTIFIAVGAGHLAGKDSVQSLLKTKKLKAVRIN